MTREEKIEVMFESILSELEKINKRKNGLPTEDHHCYSEDIIQKLESLVQKLGSLKISVQNSGTDQTDNKLNAVIEKLSSITMRTEDLNMFNKEGHSKSMKKISWPSISSGIIIAIVAILIISLGINFYTLPN